MWFQPGKYLVETRYGVVSSAPLTYPNPNDILLNYGGALTIDNTEIGVTASENPPRTTNFYVAHVSVTVTEGWAWLELVNQRVDDSEFAHTRVVVEATDYLLPTYPVVTYPTSDSHATQGGWGNFINPAPDDSRTLEYHIGASVGPTYETWWPLGGKPPIDTPLKIMRYAHPALPDSIRNDGSEPWQMLIGGFFRATKRVTWDLRNVDFDKNNAEFKGTIWTARDDTTHVVSALITIQPGGRITFPWGYFTGDLTTAAGHVCYSRGTSLAAPGH